MHDRDRGLEPQRQAIPAIREFLQGPGRDCELRMRRCCLKTPNTPFRGGFVKGQLCSLGKGSLSLLLERWNETHFQIA